MADAIDRDTTVADLGEFGLIERIGEMVAATAPGEDVLLGPGDDAAVLRVRKGHVVVSTDMLVEGRHFRRDWAEAADVGHRAAAQNLSDINAMGGVATALTVGLATPPGLPVAWAVDFSRGFEEECAVVGAHLVGGDVTESDTLMLAVTAMGDAPRPVRRDGALPGDVVAIAGRLGLAGAGYAALSRGFRSPRQAVEAHRVPQPPYAAGPQAAAAGATSMTDVSDGLVADAGHLAAASGVAIDLWTEAFVVHEAVETVGGALGIDPLRFVLTGGDDYALVATFSAQTSLPDGWAQIGLVADGSGVTVDGKEYEGAGGHEHFR